MVYDKRYRCQKYCRCEHSISKRQGYCHKDFHSGNILQDEQHSYISDFGLTGPADKQNSNDKIYG
ncbi:7354_t:CDS:2, partial [Funneliformis geosporum]